MNKPVPEEHISDFAASSDPQIRTPQLIKSKDHTRHIAVRDENGPLSYDEPLSAYMTGPEYASGRTARVAPKRPLGTRRRAKQPVRLYSQVASMGAMDRIRRPRMNIPVEEISDDHISLMHRASVLWSKSRAVALGALAFVGAKVQAAGGVVLHGLRSIPLGHGRTTYSVFRGARFERFGIARTWFKYVIPLVVIVFLLGLAIFNNWLGDLTRSPGQTQGGKGGGANNGTVTLQVNTSASKKTGSAGGTNGSSAAKGSNTTSQHPSGGTTSSPAAADSVQSAAPSSGAVQSSGARGGGSASGTVYGGGYGGGSSSGGTLPVSGGSGGGIISQPISSPVSTTPISLPSSGSDSSGGCSSCSGGGSSSPLPVTAPSSPVTVPDTTQTLNQTLSPVTQSAPTVPQTNTLNSTTNTLNSTTSGLSL